MDVARVVRAHVMALRNALKTAVGRAERVADLAKLATVPAPVRRAVPSVNSAAAHRALLVFATRIMDDARWRAPRAARVRRWMAVERVSCDAMPGDDAS